MTDQEIWDYHLKHDREGEQALFGETLENHHHYQDQSAIFVYKELGRYKVYEYITRGPDIISRSFYYADLT